MTDTIWLEEQLIRALERVETLSRDLARLQADEQVRDQQLDAMQVVLATVDGRTQRHEAVLDTVRGLQHEVATLGERLADEASLRREQNGAAERREQQALAAEQANTRAVQEAGERLDRTEQALTATQEHQARLTGEVGTLVAQQAPVASRIEALAAQVDAAAGAVQREVSNVARLEEAMAALQHIVRTLDARTGGLHDQQQQFAGAVAALPLEEHERQLAELGAYERALAARLDEGLTLLREGLETVQAVQANEAQARALLRTRLGALEQALSATDAAVAGQREVLIEHFQRTTAAAAEAGRREAEELDRQARARHELLVRLSERTDEASREQPL